MFHHDPQNTGYSDSTAPDTNDLLWSIWTTTSMSSSPAIVGDKLVTTSYSVQCFNAFNGENLWTSYTDATSLASPAVADGKVFVGGQYNIYCFSLENGSTIWTSPVSGTIQYSSATVSDDKVYIGSGDSGVPIISCFNAEDGTLLWENSTSDGTVIYSCPAVEDGKVYVIGGSTLYCFDANNGELLWDKSPGSTFGSPAVIDGKVYMCDLFGTVYCLDEITDYWQYSTGEFNAYSSPAVAYNRVYIGAGSSVYCINADTGAYVWDYTTDDNVQSSPAVADGKVYVGSNDKKIYCLDANNGNKIWDYLTEASFGSASPSIAHGIVYGPAGNDLYAFFPNNPPNTPNVPSGPTTGAPKIEYTFLTSTTEPDGNQVYYIWDWNDTTEDIFGPFDSGEIVEGTHEWDVDGIYEIRVKAKDIYGWESDWSGVHTIELVNNPPEKPTIDGPTEGLVGEPIKFQVVTTDPDGHMVKYLVDWGQYMPKWSGFVPSGQIYNKTVTFETPGIKHVKAKARDEVNDESEWSDIHTIEIFEPEFELGEISTGFGVIKTEITNTGSVALSNVTWNISVKGGVLGRIDVLAGGNIDEIPIDETESISTKGFGNLFGYIFGLGVVDINVTVTADKVDEQVINKQGSVLLFLFFNIVDPL